MRTRLFWKILLAFWLTFFAITQGVWLLFQLQRDDRGPPERFMVERMAPTLLAAAKGEVERSGKPGFDALVRSLPTDQRARLQLVEAGEAASPRSGDFVHSLSREAVAPDRRRFRVNYWYRDERRRADIFNMPLELLTLGLVGGLFFAAMLGWYLTRPIIRLRKGFDRLAQGRLSERLAPVIGNRRDEIADLAHDFDRMAQRLEELVGARDRLLHDVSHELRSPLARLQLAIGLARQAPERTEASLARIDHEVARLDALVGELLSLARSEHRAGESDDYFDLADVLRSVIEDAQFEANSHDVSIRLHGEAMSSDQAPPIRGDAEAVRRAIDNIVRNAIRFSESGQSVDVDYRLEAGAHCVLVADRGPGIDEASINAMFEPFARGSEESVGFGLGLSIAKRSIAIHRGTIAANNRLGGGLAVRLCIPITELSAE
ncbi:HAMP domain-containing sensor histidine kinase [Sphingopyxis chilensis]|uniref:HAMP domain-containing sensor histidine kinase n=1 Tax=Sphingopyxis chilensis TaxID=180400 RepID=UPI002DDCC3F5|nr:ATP-binding protein [Sphingopyxis chilensis]